MPKIPHFEKGGSGGIFFQCNVVRDAGQGFRIGEISGNLELFLAGAFIWQTQLRAIQGFEFRVFVHQNTVV